MAKNKTHISYPAFVFLEKPENLKRITRTETGLYTVENDKYRVFGSVSLAYDHIINNLHADPVFDAFELNPDLVEGDEGYSGDRHSYFEKIVGKKNKEAGQTRLLFSYTNKDRKEALKETYKDFLTLHEKWKTNKKDWVTAWEWVAKHPALWHTHTNLPYYWETENGWESHYLSVWKDEKKGKDKVLIEHGPFADVELLDERTIPHAQSSHDYRLDTTAETYHEAVIKFAKRLNKFYNIKGEERKSKKT